MPLATKRRMSEELWSPKLFFVQLPECWTREAFCVFDDNGALTGASVYWTDGASGSFMALAMSTAFPGEVDSYRVTHQLGGVTTTYTQPGVTRNTAGDVIVTPAIVVS